MGTLYKAFGDLVFPKAFGGMKELPNEEQLREKFKTALGWANDFVKETGYIAGTKSLTIADIAFMGSFSTFAAIGIWDLKSKFPELYEWFERVKAELPEYEEACGKGAEMLGTMFKSMLAQ